MQWVRRAGCVCRRISCIASAERGLHTRVAFVAVGDELLSGKIQDVNFPYLAHRLTRRGVDVVRAEFVSDDRDDIAETIRRLRRDVVPDQLGAVITSGGIGPTHDDRTYEAIAAATGTTLAVHEPTLERMRAHYEAQGKEVNSSRLRMATLPVGSEVLVAPSLWVPVVNADNVYVLPGIPRLFKALVDAHIDRFRGPSGWQLVSIFTSAGEGDYAAALGEIAERHPEVSIGSYPGDLAAPGGGGAPSTKITVEGRDASALSSAAAAVRALVPVLREEADGCAS